MSRHPMKAKELLRVWHFDTTTAGKGPGKGTSPSAAQQVRRKRRALPDARCLPEVYITLGSLRCSAGLRYRIRDGTMEPLGLPERQCQDLPFNEDLAGWTNQWGNFFRGKKKSSLYSFRGGGLSPKE